MLQQIRVSIISILISSFMFADVFMTELTDPENSSTAGRYVELYNNGDEVVDLSLGWTVQRWTNDNDAATSVRSLTGSIVPGGFYIICNDLDKFATTYSSSAILCDQDIGTGGFADSNGDDNMELLYNGEVVDVFGVPGEDGTNTWHEFEDGRAERAQGVTSGCITPDLCEVEWNIDNDSGGGDGNQYAPEGFDPGSWIGAGEAPTDVYGCMDVFGLNFNSEATADDGGCEYATYVVETGNNYFSPEDLTINMGESVQWNNIEGGHDVVADDGSFNFDACSGPCLIGSHTFDIPGTFSYVCTPHAAMGMVGTITVVDPTVSVTFSVDMSIESVGDDGVSVRVIGGDWFAMDDTDGDMIYTYTMNLFPGDYQYNFYDGWYEDGGFGDCAGGDYANDRFLTVVSDVTLDTVCWESCEACPAAVEGCMDSAATNYNADATVPCDGCCEYPSVEYANLFFSEYAEGSSNNKYLEIYNASGAAVDLSDYAFPNSNNGSDGTYDYWNTFNEGASVSPGDVYVICHGSSDAIILAECDQYHTYLSNGDDGFCLVGGSEGNFEVLDCVGDWNADPGSGWEIAGVSNATKDHTIVRKASITTGNDGQWDFSAGESEDDSEWVVLDQDDWTYIGSHPHSFEPADVDGCMDMNATNYNADATVQSYDDNGTSTCTYASCSDIPTATGCLWDTGQSAEWWEGWWNCTEGGGEVCGLAEVIFELNLPDTDDLQGNPHVNGSYNGWCGSCYNDMQFINGVWTHTQYFSEGETHDYKFTMDGWSNQEDLTGLGDCAVQTDGNWNRQFTTGAPNTSQRLTNCWGTCEAECAGAPSCGDGVCDENEDCSSCSVDCGACPESAVTFDIDGIEDCGQVNITGTWDNWSGWGVNPADHPDYTISLQSGSYEFVILCVNTEGEWWNDVWANSTVFNAPTECDVNDTGNYGFTVADMDMTVSSCAGTCDAVCAEECAHNGDANGDGTVNVTDIVLVVGSIIAGTVDDELLCSADVNSDGLVNVTDIVWVVGTIVNGAASNSNSFIATDAVINIANNTLSIDGINGDISGVQLVLSHGSDFNIILENTDADNLEFSGKKEINKNTTEFFIVKDDLNVIGTTVGEYSILSAIVVTGKGQSTQEIASTVIDLPESFELKSAYPNPFNPITTLELAIPETGYISVKVYNLVGQEVATLVNGVVNATDSYTFQWNANNVSSGIYLVRAEGFGSIQTQKLMLLK